MSPIRRAAVCCTLLGASAAGIAATTGLYDDGQIFANATVSDIDTCGGSQTASLEVYGIHPEVDIIVAMDASGSVGSSNWELAEDAVLDLLGVLDIADDGEHVGLIQFATSSTLQHSLSDTQDGDTLAATVDGFTFTGGWTNTRDALQDAIDEFDTYGRADAGRVLLLLTDGQPYGPSGPEAVCDYESALKSRGIEVLVVGVGTGWINQDGPEKVGCLVNDTDSDLLYVSDFDALDLTDLPNRFPAAQSAVMEFSVGSDFSVDALTPSAGSVTQTGATISWEIDEINGDSTTLDIDFSHSSTAGGTLTLLQDGALSFTDIAGDDFSDTLADVSIAVEGCDADGDGYTVDEGDCNDGDDTVYPGAEESCADLGVDNDCDGSTTDADDPLTWYADDDGDTLGDAADSLVTCEQPAGYVDNDDDLCPDEDATGWDADLDGCIDDTDGDGVPDDVDVCPDSTFDLDSSIDESGCSVDDYCPCDSDWKNHGEYTSCVSTVTNTFKKDGILSGSEKGAIQSAAAQSDCGR